VNKISGVFAAIKNNWGKFILFLLLIPVFAVMIFPLDDLGDFVSAQVSAVTGNKVYVRFDHLGLSVVPQPGMKLKQVYVEGLNFPGISVAELTFSPSIAGLIKSKPYYGHLSADGVLRGRVSIDIGNGKRTEDGAERIGIDAKINKVSLLMIKDLAQLPVTLRGDLSLNIDEGQVEPTFKVQPDVPISVTIDKFELPSTTLPVAGGVTLPEIHLSKVVLTGRLSGGRLSIQNGTIGDANDEIHGTVKGSIGLTIQNVAGQGDVALVPVFGNYDLELDLTLKKSFQEKAGVYLTMADTWLSNYSVAPSSTNDGVKYKFKISGQNFVGFPQFSALR
jgi:type II secretion system protein N